MMTDERSKSKNEDGNAPIETFIQKKVCQNLLNFWMELEKN